LYTAKKKVDHRIVVLGGEDDQVRIFKLFEYSSLTDTPQKPIQSETPTTNRLTLRDVLTTPTSLSYFMEFMDRRNRSLLIQFWLTVESFKNPLEAVDSDSSGDDDDELIQHSETVKEDITMVNDLYFSSPTPHPALSVISAKHINAIRVFALDESTATPSAERKVKRNVMLAQRQVERDMEGDFEDFQRSPLWFRVVGDAESNNAMAASVTSSSVLPDSGLSPFTAVRGNVSPSPSLRTSRINRSPIMINPPLTTRSESLPSLTAVSTEREPLSSSRPIQSSLNLLMSSTENIADSSRAPLFDESEDTQRGLMDDAQAQRMDAIQAALTDIIAFDNEESSHSRPETPDEAPSQRGSGFLSTRRPDGRRQPSFDEEQDVEEERHDEHDSNAQTALPLAGPGDLQLAYEIARLGEKLNNLRTQDTMLDRLINKADLTGDTQELRLLQKSKSALNREIRELSFQKTQYELQESANRLVSDRTKLAIVNSTVGEEGGKSVVRYIVEVQQLAIDGSFATGWVVARRYNEFLQMHNRLRDKYALVRGLDFPGKRIVTGLSGHFVDTRRAALEKYMQVRRTSRSYFQC
jgi:sorting nexin-25